MLSITLNTFNTYIVEIENAGQTLKAIGHKQLTHYQDHSRCDIDGPHEGDGCTHD